MWKLGKEYNHYVKKCYNCMKGFKIQFKTYITPSVIIKRWYCICCGIEWGLEPWEE